MDGSDLPVVSEGDWFGVDDVPSNSGEEAAPHA